MNWQAMVIGALIYLPHAVAKEYNYRQTAYWQLKLTWEPWVMSLGIALLILSVGSML